jgi:hypothetical protein
MYQCKFNPGPLSPVTRQKIPTKTIQSWNFPKEHDNSSSDSDELEDGENNNLRILRSQSGKLLKDIDTISISSDSSMLLP